MTDGFENPELAVWSFEKINSQIDFRRGRIHKMSLPKGNDTFQFSKSSSKGFMRIKS